MRHLTLSCKARTSGHLAASVTVATDNVDFFTDTVNRSLALVTVASMVVMSGFARKTRLHSSGTPAKKLLEQYFVLAVFFQIRHSCIQELLEMM